MVLIIAELSLDFVFWAFPVLGDLMGSMKGGLRFGQFGRENKGWKESMSRQNGC
jgi:hypothetical protein